MKCPVGTAPTVAAKAPQLWSMVQATAMTQAKHRGTIPYCRCQSDTAQGYRQKTHEAQESLVKETFRNG